MLLQRMPAGHNGMRKLFNFLHPYFLHHSFRTLIGQRSKRINRSERKMLLCINQTSFCCFGSISLIPTFLSQPPANLNPRSKINLKSYMMKSCISDERVIFLPFNSIQAVAKLSELIRNPITKVQGFCFRQPFQEELHHHRIFVHIRKRAQVLLFPVAQQQTGCFNVYHVSRG